MEIKDFKRKYGVLAKKYKMPGFDELNADFEVDKLDKDSDHLLRAVRKVMMEKVVNSLNFLDMLANPVNAPRIYHSYIKGMSVEDKKTIDEMYVALAELSFLSLAMEVDCDEKKEAELINRSVGVWKEVKPRFGKVIGNIQKPNDVGVRKEKSYFG